MFSFVLKIFSNTGPSITLSTTSSNLFSGHASPMKAFFALKCSGGKNYESNPIFNAFSSMFGISLASKGLESSRQGFVFTSIKYGRNSSSIIKSSPNTSILFNRRLGSNLLWQALNISAVILFIYGLISLSKQIFKSPKCLSKNIWNSL